MFLLFPSAEVRWFFPGELPASLDQWFHSGGLWQRSSPRTDAYLYFPHSQSAGVKFREGRFEIKALVAHQGLHTFGKGIAGNVEQWEKWSLDLGKMDLPPESQWIEVQKSRTLRRFMLEGDRAKEIKADTYPDEGCNAELTHVKALNQSWWSLALESFGKMERTEFLLKTVGEHILRQAARDEVFPAAYPFDAAHSLSYPAWLQKVASGEV